MEGLMRGESGGAAKAADYANYFSSYACLYHQKEMLTDTSRMEAYRSAIFGNAEKVIAGKRVLDVGAGSGILSIWAAQAGAAKVYAVEFTSMAKHARALVEANGLCDVVEVRQCAVEELEGIEVDVIVSEWMGYFLLRESMLDSVIYARDNLLCKEGGAILPNRANLWWAPMTAPDEREKRIGENIESLANFEAFADEMKRRHGVSVDCLRPAYANESGDYYLKQALWYELQDDQILAAPAHVASLDLYTITLEEARAVEKIDFDFEVGVGSVDAFAGWFDTSFDATKTTPFDHPVLLSTDPKYGYTHWGQQVFFLGPERDRHHSKKTRGTFSLTRQQTALRLYSVHVEIHDEEDQSKTILALDWEIN